MKFTKEQVLENIKAKFRTSDGKTSQKISDRTILDTVEPLLAFASDETELNDFSDKVFGGINSANTNFIKDTTDFVKGYKPEPVRTEPTPIAAPTPEPTDIAALVTQAVAQAIQPYQDKIVAFETARSAESVVSTVKEKLDKSATIKQFPKQMARAIKYGLREFEHNSKSMTAEELESFIMRECNELVSEDGLDFNSALNGGSSDTHKSVISKFLEEEAEHDKKEVEQRQAINSYLGLDKEQK